MSAWYYLNRSSSIYEIELSTLVKRCNCNIVNLNAHVALFYWCQWCYHFVCLAFNAIVPLRQLIWKILTCMRHLSLQNVWRTCLTVNAMRRYQTSDADAFSHCTGLQFPCLNATQATSTVRHKSMRDFNNTTMVLLSNRATAAAKLFTSIHWTTAPWSTNA